MNFESAANVQSSNIVKFKLCHILLTTRLQWPSGNMPDCIAWNLTSVCHKSRRDIQWSQSHTLNVLPRSTQPSALRETI